MTTCSSNIGVSHVVNERTGAILRNLWNQTSNISFLSFKSVLKEATLPVFCVNGSNRHVSFKREEGALTINLSLPPDESKSTPPDESKSTTTTLTDSTKGGNNILEMNHNMSERGPDSKTDGYDNNGVVCNIGGGNGNFGSGRAGGGGGGGNSDDGDNKEEEEFGPILNYEEVMRETEARRAILPSDMLEAAKSVGIRKVILLRYLELQGSVWPLGFAMRSFSVLRSRMLADPSFLFKIGSEIIIDSTCATFAEVQKRGKDFWDEFELYVADLLVGTVVNVALVGMLAPYARIGQPSVSKGFLGRMQQAYASLPSSVFEAERPGCRFSLQQRIGTYFYKGIMYGAVGFGCGIIGQGIANLIMTAKRSIRKSEEDIPVPPLVKSAALWGVFLAVSSNTRYQIVNGLERLVEASPLAKQVPPVALAFTVGVRFANNVYGGMQFVDWARWSGVQ